MQLQDEICIVGEVGGDMPRQWELQNVMVSCGLKTRARAWLDGLLRASVFLAPEGLRAKVYEFFLRKQATVRAK